MTRLLIAVTTVGAGPTGALLAAQAGGPPSPEGPRGGEGGRGGAPAATADDLADTLMAFDRAHGNQDGVLTRDELGQPASQPRTQAGRERGGRGGDRR